MENPYTVWRQHHWDWVLVCGLLITRRIKSYWKNKISPVRGLTVDF